MTLDPTASRPPADLAGLPGREAVLARLSDALRGEHALIVQLMSHGYRLRDEDALHVIEGISRQDMRHFKWLAETVVRLGGTPTLERGPVALAPAAPHVWLAADVALLDAQTGAYSELLDSLDGLTGEEPAQEVRQLIARIRGDKLYHREKLLALAEAWEGRELPAPQPAAHGEVDEQANGFLDFAIGHEYEVILQYLHHAFLLEDQWASRQLEDVAIEEMRHLGWLTEALVERGGCPYWEARRLELHDDAVRMLELDQQRELEVEADYAQMTAAMSDPAIRRLFDRIGDHERFHAGTLGRLVARLQGAPAAGAALPGLGAGVAVASPPAPPPPVPAREEPAPAAPAPVPPRVCPYTVGSLFGQPQS